MPMKTCTRCGETKPLTEFNRQAGTKDGLKYLCRSCHKAQHQQYSALNRESEIRRARDWNLRNPQAKAAHQSTWRAKNPDRLAALTAKRKAAQLRATPPWADQEKINAVYQEAAALRALGVDVHVDHIVPLRCKRASGLHVHTNLQILLADDNRRKGSQLPVSVS
jgi:NMD protein affecting ribosome stability and mRNA decay